MINRLLLLAPTARDAALSTRLLAEAGLACHTCADLAELVGELDQGAGAILLTETALGIHDLDALAAILGRQPTWSDIPVVLLSPRGADSPIAVWAMNTLGNVTVLEQPIRVMTLISALRSALKARQRQYELRDQLEALRRSRALLADADRRKDEFLATLSHELRNPLAPIRNALHVLRLAGTDPETRARVMDTMERQVGTVIRLVDDLLELSRVTQGRIELRKERVRLDGILRNALESSGPLIEAAGHELIVEVPPETVLLEADPVRLSQVIANLLNNAAKYTDKGGRVWLTVQPGASDVVISVRDTGYGIPATMLTEVFEMFVQAHPSADRTRQGLGIGLTLVKRLVELHGGTVEARSAGPGQGSEFVVRLARLADQRSPSGDAARRFTGERRRSPASSFRILVVDDHHDAGDSLAVLLRLLGHDVRQAYDGPAALAALDADRADVILLDIGMPEMDGYEVARRIRQRPDSRETLLVALTGFGRDADRRRSRDAGFDHHLTKPADLAALNGLLADHAARTNAPPAPPQEPELGRRAP
ncbi:MAG: hybrid sensor histidine kinase/response regulator [Gemmatimonadales bacterium]|nr:hybrid sensor histidine kinase/response regulator [Gemmatimonadales bacterium]